MAKEKRPEDWGRMGYYELLGQMKFISSAKEARLMHKCLKKYGDGLTFHDRYPNFPIVIGCISVAVSLACYIKQVIG